MFRRSFSFALSLLVFASMGIKISLSMNRVMVWMCLEFCDETPSQIDKNLAQINEHKAAVSAVSFEKYTLGPDSLLVDNNLTEVSDKIKEMGLESWPLLSSYPHPTEFINWMRQVFINPSPFIESCIKEAVTYGYRGYNLDWEPTDEVTEADGVAYASFIDEFGRALHDHQLLLTVDVATWSVIWNNSLIEKTCVDRAISMGTYTSTDASFSSQLETIVDIFGVARAGVGLETVNASTEQRMSLGEVHWRFQEIRKSGATEIDLWKMPVPPLWWPLIDAYVASN